MGFRENHQMSMLKWGVYNRKLVQNLQIPVTKVVVYQIRYKHIITG